MEQYVKGFKGFTPVKMCGLSPLASFYLAVVAVVAVVSVVAVVAVVPVVGVVAVVAVVPVVAVVGVAKYYPRDFSGSQYFTALLWRSSHFAYIVFVCACAKAFLLPALSSLWVGLVNYLKTFY